MTLVMAVPNKSANQFAAERVAAFLEEIGCLHQDMIAKSDQEPAIRSMVDDVGKLKAGKGGPLGEGALPGGVECLGRDDGEGNPSGRGPGPGAEAGL